MMFVAAVKEELGDLRGAPVGIGPVRAALGAARLLAGARPSAVVLVGTAGAYPGGPPIGSVVVARHVGLSEGIGELGLGYVPLAPGPITTDDTLRRRAKLPEFDVLTVDAITTDRALTTARAARWQVEHMESWSVAAAAEAAGVPFVALLGITNEVGPDAHAQWLANRGAVESAVRDAARALLGAS